MRFSVSVFGDVVSANELFAVGRRARDASPVLSVIAGDMKETTKRQFESEGSEQGTPWAPLSDERVEQRGSAHPILRDTDDLFREATEATNYRVTNDSVKFELSDNEVEGYALAQQFGSESNNLPARPFVVFNKKDERAYTNKIRIWVLKGLLFRR